MVELEQAQTVVTFARRAEPRASSPRRRRCRKTGHGAPPRLEAANNRDEQGDGGRGRGSIGILEVVGGGEKQICREGESVSGHGKVDSRTSSPSTFIVIGILSFFAALIITVVCTVPRTSHISATGSFWQQLLVKPVMDGSKM